MGAPVGARQAARSRATRLRLPQTCHQAGGPGHLPRHSPHGRPWTGRALGWCPSASPSLGILVGSWCLLSGRISRGCGCFAGRKSVSTTLSGERGTSSVSTGPEPASPAECWACRVGWGGDVWGHGHSPLPKGAAVEA